MAKRDGHKLRDAAPLARLKAVANIQDDAQDPLLTELLAQAEEYILAYTNRAELLDSMSAGHVRLALLYYNRMGVEGQSAHSEGGVSRSIDDLPQSIVKWLNMYRLTPDAARARGTESGASDGKTAG